MRPSARDVLLVLCVALVVVAGIGSTAGASPERDVVREERPTRSGPVTPSDPGEGADAGAGANSTVAEATGEPTKSTQPLGDEVLAGSATLAQAAALGDDDTRVVVELAPDRPAAHRDRLRDYGARIDVSHGPLVQATLPTTNVTEVAALPWVRTVRRPNRPMPTRVSEGVAVVDADTVHATGVSGDGVRVGVIDLGFDASAPEISDNVVASRSFTTGSVAPENRAHGTAVSELVVDTAPNASLYLARVDTDVEFAAAVSWLRANDVDVITMSLNWVNQPYDGTGFVSRVADEAVADGIVWTNSAGNYARSHWEARYRNTDGDRWIEFGPGDERNYLNEGRALSGRVGVSLSWNDWPRSDDDYDLYLYRDVPPYGSLSRGEDVLVARSTGAQTGVQRPTEFVSPTLERGVYYVTIANYAADGSHVLELYTRDAAGPLEHKRSRSSLAAPATARDVVTVGAFDRVSGNVEPFSSRGPTNDGRRGVDIVGPNRVSTGPYRSFTGTSAAAPYVAGVGALVRERKPGASPRAVERRLTNGAIDVPPDGPDPTSGYGRLNATRAVFSEDDIGRVAVGQTRRSVVDSDDPVSTAFRGYHERVALSGVEGVRVRIEMRSSSDPYLFLLAPNGSVVATDDDSGAGLNASLTHTFERTGRYTVVTTGFGSNDTLAYELSVQEQPERTLRPVSLVVSPQAATVEPGDAVTFTVTRADTGAPVNATLVRDDERVVTGTDGTAALRFDQPGTYRVTVTAPPTETERFRTDEVTVSVDEPEPDPPRFEVSSLSVPETVQRGDVVHARATVTNTGEAAGTQTVRVGVDRDGDGTLEPLGDETVELASGESDTVSRTVSIPRNLAPGTYTVGVWTANETVTTTVRVES